MKAKKYQVIITAYNANNDILFSKAQGLFGSNRRILYNTEKEAQSAIEFLKSMIEIPPMSGNHVEFEIKLA